MGGTPAGTSAAANRSMNRLTACSSRSGTGSPVIAASLLACTRRGQRGGLASHATAVQQI
jgi:hypothetical protein